MYNIIKIIGIDMFNNVSNETVDCNDSIVMVVIDSIFSIQTNYKSTVLPLKIRFESYIKS